MRKTSHMLSLAATIAVAVPLSAANAQRMPHVMLRRPVSATVRPDSVARARIGRFADESEAESCPRRALVGASVGGAAGIVTGVLLGLVVEETRVFFTSPVQGEQPHKNIYRNAAIGASTGVVIGGVIGGRKLWTQCKDDELFRQSRSP